VDEIKDSGRYDFLAEKAEQDDPDETFYDEAMDFAMEMERDMYDRD
jgi:hypothetical protein